MSPSFKEFLQKLPEPRRKLPTLPDAPEALRRTENDSVPVRKAMRVAFTALALSACYEGPADELPGARSGAAAGESSKMTPSGRDDGGATGATNPTNAPTGLPCDVANVLARNTCLDCHGSSLAAPMRLLSHTDMTAPAPSDASKKVAELVVTRMRNSTNPMPPAPTARAANADIEIVEQWIGAGYPKGACGETDASLPSTPSTPSPSTTVQCSSGQTWMLGWDEAPEMNPGLACVSCHQNENARRRKERAPAGIGGTVYPTLHEPDLCLGVNGAATVIITDAQNREYPLAVNSSGNFYLYGTPAFPIRAKVVANGKERRMNTPQMSGDCNSCHTVTGTGGAPGRIMLP
jgi:hypothetical protein